MKTKGKIAIGVTIVLLGVLITAAMRDPANGPDVALVNSVQPFNWQVSKIRSFAPNRKMRRYSLHMKYDDAVRALDKELTPLGWTHKSFYSACTFKASGRSNDFVMVERMRLQNEVKFAAGTPTSSTMPPYRITTPPLVDPHGWVIVTTFRAINPMSGFFASLHVSAANSLRGHPQYFYAAMPMPKIGSAEQPVDINTDTSALEGKAIAPSLFSTS